MFTPSLFTVDAFNQREPHHFAAVNRHYFRQLFYLGKGITGDKWATEEIIQHLFVRLWTNGKRFDDLEELHRYLVLAVTDASLEYITEESVTHGPSDGLAVNASGIMQPETLTLPTRMEVVKLLRETMDQLPLASREVVQRMVVEDQPREDVARDLQLHPDEVDRHLLSAIAQLQKAFPTAQWRDEYLELLPYVCFLGYSRN